MEQVGGTIETRSERRIRIFLRDHQAILVGASELARRSLKNNAQGELRVFLDSLISELERDRALLAQAAERFGLYGEGLRARGAWLAEKLGRLKLNGQFVGYSPLSRVVELEGLLMLAAQREAMWGLLQAQVRGDHRWSGLDFGQRKDVARKEREELEGLLARAAMGAF